MNIEAQQFPRMCVCVADAIPNGEKLNLNETTQNRSSN